MYRWTRLCRLSLSASFLLWPLCNLTSAEAAAGRANKPAGQNQSDAPASSQIGISPTSLTFAQQQIWTTSAAKLVNIKNVGSTVLDFVSIVASGDYSETNNCASSLQPGKSCRLQVTFTPSASGQRTGYVTLSDSDPTILQTVNLSGTGSVPATKLTVSPGVASITSGQTEQFTAAINGVGTSKVTWSVDGIVGGNSTVGMISVSGLYTPPPFPVLTSFLLRPPKNQCRRPLPGWW